MPRRPINRTQHKDQGKTFLLTWDLYEWVKVRSKALGLTENAYGRAILSADKEYCSRSPKGITAPIIRTVLTDRTIDRPANGSSSDE